MDTSGERVVLQGARFNVHEMELLGSDGKTYRREVIHHPGAVVLLPLLDQDTVVLIENSRPSVGETLLELPAGTRESDEPPEQTAARELVEETGYHAGRLDARVPAPVPRRRTVYGHEQLPCRGIEHQHEQI